MKTQIRLKNPQDTAAPITTARATLTTRLRSSRRWSNRGIRPSGFSRRLARA